MKPCLFPAAIAIFFLAAGCDKALNDARKTTSETTPVASPDTEPVSTTGAITLTIEPKALQKITQWGVATQNRPDWGPDFAIAARPNSLDAIYNDLGTTMLRYGIPYDADQDAKKLEALKQVSGTHDLKIVFTSPEHWHEVALKWFQFAGQIEA